MTRVRAALAVVACLAAVPAMALAPPLMCDGPDAPGTSAEIGGYNHSRAGEGFVVYTGYESATEATVDVLEYCPGKRQMLIRTQVAGSDPVLDAAAVAMLDEMIHGVDAYTMDQMARRIRALGVPVEIRTVNYVSCACAQQWPGQ